jgi:Xaa-Pro dipeptidase
MIGGSTAEAELGRIRAWSEPASPISSAERMERVEKARRLTRDAGADALLIGAGDSLRYFAGVPWGATERLVAMLLPVSGDPIIIAPAFELGSLHADLGIDAAIRTWEEDECPAARVAAALRETGGDTLAIDPGLAFLFVDRIAKAAPAMTLVSGAPIVDGCRMYKSAGEIALLQQAKWMTQAVHRHAARILAPGIRASAVKRFIDEAHRAIGAPGGSTFCAVQFGRSTAYPHGLPQDDVLAEGDLVLIDTGCRVDGYHSDITRTYVFGEPTARVRDLWDLEHEAQRVAFEAAEPGRLCEDVDNAARAVLERNGLGPDYRLPGLPHRTGHGIGLSIHEPAYLVRGDKTPLAAGLCFSNEPMIVVPGELGIRLEDHFYMAEDGPRWFTQPPASIDAPV